MDPTEKDAIAGLFDRLASRFGGLDVLINNAGTCFMSGFPEIPAAKPERQRRINFRSAFQYCRQAVKAMAGRPGARKIVNIRSNGACNFDALDPDTRQEDGLDRVGCCLPMRPA
ncbi:SDR family oxidoreductase [Tabrizicola caldifontis]|uniref:SDR family oxidoreductase n=1 Tax=Tabrizicola caldifontis TaxID=2528036 RepID=UPI001436714F|nr:SDR family oxidoreductase [Rhodobacter sp. YIM 73028]